MELLLRASSCSAVSGPHQPPDSSHRITQSELDLLNVGGIPLIAGLGRVLGACVHSSQIP